MKAATWETNIRLEEREMKQDYEIREMKEEEFLPLFDKHKKSVFGEVHSYSLNDLLNNAEQERIKTLGQGTPTPYKLFLGAVDKDKQFFGWSWGQQENSSTFYIVNSAILPDHRRKGLYGALIGRCSMCFNEGIPAYLFQTLCHKQCRYHSKIKGWIHDIKDGNQRQVRRSDTA